MGRKVFRRGARAGRIASAALIAASMVPIAVHAVPAHAQTANSCLAIENNRSRETSVAVVGFNETSGYWSFAAGESAVLANGGGPIHGSTFTIRLYDGEGVNTARQLDGSNKYVNWRYDAQNTDQGKCPDGAWVATLHD